MNRTAGTLTLSHNASHLNGLAWLAGWLVGGPIESSVKEIFSNTDKLTFQLISTAS